MSKVNEYLLAKKSKTPSAVGGKFEEDPIQLHIKRRLRCARIEAGFLMAPFSKVMGITRKQLEDLETTRNYGCFWSIEKLWLATQILNLSIDEVLNEKF